MASEHANDLWALVFSGGRAYIGASKPDEDLSERVMAEKLAKGVANSVVLNPCYEVSVLVRQGQDNNGRPVMQKNVTAEPVMVSLEGSPVFLLYTGVIFFADMKESDRARYKSLAATAEQLALQARAAESGIVTSSGGAAPRG